MPETYRGHEIRVIWEGRYYRAEIDDGQYLTVGKDKAKALSLAKDIVDVIYLTRAGLAS